MAGKILLLPEEVCSQLRSGVTITSVIQCVEELVLNSLDAGATCIAVRVDMSIFRIQVVDNGEGVPHADLKYLGTRHATSKCHSLKDLNNHLSHYGFRGEALASAINLSAVVDITTHPQSSTQTFTKLFTYGKEKSVDISKTNRPSVGTTITIQDFMYNMPVRRKLIREAIDLESIRMRLESFALMHPNVAFSLRNDRNGNMIIQTKKSRGTMATFMQLYGEERAQGLAEVHHSVNQFTVSGYIGTQPHLTKALQFVYVNKRVILRTKIHRMVNDLLARSSIISSRLHPCSLGPVKSPSSPPKGMKLHGIFVLNIECPYSEYDICLEPSKTLVEFKEWDELLLCIEELILKFAKEENLGISLDERYKRSGKEYEEKEKEEEELSLSQSSQISLQLFNQKRNHEDAELSGSSKQKYGRTLNTQDNLLAVHSEMVKRVKKEAQKCEKPIEKKNSCNELDKNNKAIEESSKYKEEGSPLLPKMTDGSALGILREIKKNSCEDTNDNDRRARKSPQIHSNDTEDCSLQCVGGTLEKIYTTETEWQDMHPMQLEDITITENGTSECKNFTDESESDEVVSLAAPKKKRIQSVLEEFKIVMGEVDKRYDSTETDMDLILAPAVSTQQECRDMEKVQQGGNTLSTLEQFMEFHNREQKSIQDGFHTPEEDMIATPTSPPILKSPHPSSLTPLKEDVLTLATLTERIEQSPPVVKSVRRECDFEARKRVSEFTENRTADIHKSKHIGEKSMSLSKSLSGKIKMHQSKSKTILSLKEKFGFSKTNTSQSKVETHTLLSSKHVREGHSSPGNGDTSVVPTMECPRFNKHLAKNEGRGRLDGEVGNDFLESYDCLKVNEDTADGEGKVRIGSDMNSSVLTPKLCSQINTPEKIGERNGWESPVRSFMFEPVITRTFQQHDACLSHAQSSRETLTVNLDSRSQDVVELQYKDGGEREQNPFVRSSSVCDADRNITDNEGVANALTINNQHIIACSQLNTPPRQSSALLQITENYASTPEDCDGSPQRPYTSLMVPAQIDFDDKVLCPQAISFMNNQGGEQHNSNIISTTLHSTQDYVPQGNRNITEREGRLFETAMEGEPQPFFSEVVIDNDSPQVNSFDSKFNGRQDYIKNSFKPCEKQYLGNSIEKEVIYFNNSGNAFNIQINSSSLPIKQSIEVSASENQQRSQSIVGEEVHERHQREDVLPIQASQGFTFPVVNPVGTDKQSANVEDEAFAPDCSAHNQDLTASVEVFKNIVNPTEMTSEKTDTKIVSEKTENQEPDSLTLIPSNQTSQEEICFKNILSLPSQVILKKNPVNSNYGQNLSLSENIMFETQSEPVSQGMIYNEEAEGTGKVTNGVELKFDDWASPNHLSQSLHFSQLISPDDERTSSSHDTLSAILTNCISAPSSMSGGISSEGEVMPISYDTELQGNEVEKSICCKGSVDEIGGEQSATIAMPAGPEIVCDSGNSENVVNEATLELPSGLSSLTPSLNIIPRSSENSSSFEAPKTCNCDGGSTTENSASKIVTLGVKSSYHDSLEQVGIQIPPPGSKWRKAVDKDGKTIFVDLQTGNSSYEPLKLKATPEWTNSQPLAASLHKVPLTHEPWYIPRSKNQRERDSFTLTYGFKEFMSWTKTIEMRKKESSKQIVANKNSCPTEGEVATNKTSIMSQEIQEAIATLAEDCEAEDGTVKWKEKPETLNCELSQPSEVAQICQMWELPDFAMDAEVLNSGPDKEAAPRSVAGVRVYNIVHPYKFSRDMLSSCKVLGQLDQKFIACNLKYSDPEGPSGKGSQLVVLFDQHAVHERVRLETIIQENYETQASGESVLTSAAVSPPLELNLPEDEVRLMQAYSNKFNQCGLYFTKTGPSKVKFQLIPSCLVAREVNELRHKRCQTANAIVESVVRHLCHTLQQTGSVLGVIPRPITQIFNNNACRGAIKFGDELTSEQCQALISSLHSCQLPFQCAHGRPSIVPLVNLAHIPSHTRKVSKPNLRRLREAMESGTVL